MGNCQKDFEVHIEIPRMVHLTGTQENLWGFNCPIVSAIVNGLFLSAKSKRGRLEGDRFATCHGNSDDLTTMLQYFVLCSCDIICHKYRHKTKCLDNLRQEWLRQTKPKKVSLANFPARSPELVPEPPFACKYYTKPLKEGVPELLSDSLPESSRDSLSLVWFAGATPDYDKFATTYDDIFRPVPFLPSLERG